MSDQTITLKVAGDSSGLSSLTNDVKSSLNDMGQAGAQAGQQTAAGMNQAAQGAAAAADSVGKMGQTAQTAGQASQQAGAQIAAAMQQAQQGTDTLNAQVASLRDTIIGLGELYIGKQLVSEAMDISDAYENIQAKVRLTVDTTQQQIDVSNRLFQISQDTGTAWENNAKLYQRLFNAEESAGLSIVDAQTKALALTDEITKIMITSGATAQEAKFAIQDLSHGLAEGHLQWRQLSQVMRESPQLAKTLADGLGVPIGKLKELATQGQITTQAFTAAMLSQGQAVDDQFNKMPVTFARAFETLHNSITRYIGEAADSSTATNLIKEAIIGLGNNISTVATLLATATIAMAALFTGDTINKITAWASNIVQAYTLARAQTLAYAEDKAVEAAADLKAAQSATVSNEAVLAGLKTRQDAMAQTVLNSAANVDLAKAQLAAATTAEEQQVAQVALNKAMIDGRTAGQAMLAMDAQILAAERDLTISKTNLVNATKYATIAQTEAAAAGGILQTAWRGLQSVGTSLFTLLGGWPGILLIAGAALTYFATQATDTSRIIDQLNSQAQKIAASGPSVEAAFSLWASGAKKVADSFDTVVAKQQAVLEANNKSIQNWGEVQQPMQGFALYAGQASRELDNFNHAQAEVKMASLKNEIASVVVELHNMIFGTQEAEDALHEAFGKNIDTINKETEKLKEHTIEVQQGKVAAFDYASGIQLEKAAMDANTKSGLENLTNLNDALLAKRAMLVADVAATEGKKEHTSAIKAENTALNNYQSDLQKLSNMEDQFASDLAGPSLQALSKYQHQFDIISKTWADAVAAGKANDDLINRLTKDFQDNEDQLDATNKRLKDQHDAFLVTNADLQQAILLSQTDIAQRKAVTDAYKVYNEALKTTHDLEGNEYSDRQAQIAAMNTQLPLLIQQKQRVDDVTAAMQRQDEVSKEWVNSFATAFDSLGSGFAKVASDALFHFKSIQQTFDDLHKALTDSAASLVASLISMFEKLAVINPILNAVFGTAAGGGKFLPTLSDAGGILGSLLGNSGGAGGLFSGSIADAQGSGGGSTLSSTLQLAGIGNNLFNGSGTGLIGGLFGNSAVTSLLGSTAGNGSGMLGFLFGGNGLDAAGFGPQFGGSAGLLGSNGSIGAGLGSLGAVLGGASAGYQLGGVGGAIGLGALSYAVPVVGWIAGIASLVNSLTGGDVFGTDYANTGVSFQNASVDSSGSFNYQNLAQQHKHGALFSGGSYRDVSQPLTADQQASAAALTDAIQKTVEQAASQLGTTAGALITGTFSEQLSSTGAVSNNLSKVLGQTFTDTMQQFAERIQAENVIALIDKARGDNQASQVAQQYRTNADTLSQVAQLLLQAESDLKKGQELIKGDTSLQDVVTEVTKLADANETMIQTYARLQAETQALQSSLDLMGVDIGKTGTAFVDFADAAAKAAGGATQLQSLFSTFQTEYYSGDEIAKLQLAAYQKASDQALSAIGEASTTSLAQFRTDFQNAMPKLTPDQLVQWLQASAALYAATQAQAQWNAKLVAEAAAIQASSDLLTASLDAMHVNIGKVGQDFTNLATAIATSAGGLQNAQTLWSDYFTNFYSDVERAKLQADTTQSASGSALKALGEDPNVSLAQFRQDFENALPKLTADQIVAWLQAGELLAAAAKAQTAYNTALANATQATANGQQQVQAAFQGTNAQALTLLQSMGLFGGTLTPFETSMQNITTQTQQAISAANQLAVANGQLGASSYQLAQIQQWAAQQQAAALEALKQNTQDIISQLYGGVPGSLSAINAQIQALQSSTSSFGGAVSSVGTAAANATKALQAQVALQIGNLSPLNDNQKLDIAKAAYLQGNASAQDVLTIAQRLYASSNDYKQVFDWVQANPQAQAGTGGVGGGGGGGSGGVSPQLQALYDQQAKLQAQALADQRKALAEQLAANIGDLAKQNHIDALAQMALLGVKLTDLVTDFGINLKNQTADTITGLGDLAAKLGLNFGDLINALGLHFSDLKVGFTDLAKQMGIDLTNLTGQSVKGLSDITSALKISLPNLLDGLGLKMSDIKTALVQYVGSIGVDLNNLTSKSVQSLADLSTKFNISLGALAQDLNIPLSAFTPAIKQMASDLHIDLTQVGTASGNGLAALAAKLNISLSDLASILGIKIDSTTGAVSQFNYAMAVNLTSVAGQRQQNHAALLGRFDTQTLRTAQMDTNLAQHLDAVNSTVGNVNTGVANLPSRIPVPTPIDPTLLIRSTNDLLGQIRDMHGVYLPRLDTNTGRTSTYTSQTADNTSATNRSVNTMNDNLSNTLRSTRDPVTPTGPVVSR